MLKPADIPDGNVADVVDAAAPVVRAVTIEEGAPAFDGMTIAVRATKSSPV